jgi:hypothetical protein
LKSNQSPEGATQDFPGKNLCRPSRADRSSILNPRVPEPAVAGSSTLRFAVTRFQRLNASDIPKTPALGFTVARFQRLNASAIPKTPALGFTVARFQRLNASDIPKIPALGFAVARLQRLMTRPFPGLPPRALPGRDLGDSSGFAVEPLPGLSQKLTSALYRFQ